MSERDNVIDQLAAVNDAHGSPAIRAAITLLRSDAEVIERAKSEFQSAVPTLGSTGGVIDPEKLARHARASVTPQTILDAAYNWANSQTYTNGDSAWNLMRLGYIAGASARHAPAPAEKGEGVDTKELREAARNLAASNFNYGNASACVDAAAAELDRLRAENVVWANHDPFTGEQVLALLNENSRLRSSLAEAEKVLQLQSQPIEGSILARVLHHCMEAVCRCNTVTHDGMCECSRYIGSWLRTWLEQRDAANAAMTEAVNDNADLRSRLEAAERRAAQLESTLDQVCIDNENRAATISRLTDEIAELKKGKT